MDKTFEAKLQKIPSKGGWTYVVMEGSAEHFRTKGLVKVRERSTVSHSRAHSWPSVTAPISSPSRRKFARSWGSRQAIPSPYV